MSQFVAGMVKSQAKGKFDNIMSETTQPQSQQIDWMDLNFPCKFEPFNILHFNQKELKEKKGHSPYLTVRILFFWWIALSVITGYNFINACIITAGIDNGNVYSGLNILYSIFNIIIFQVVSVTAMYKAFHAYGRPSNFSHYVAIALTVLAGLYGIVLSIAAYGNVNGFANIGSARMAYAELVGIDGYWTAACVIEGIVWLGTVGLAVFATVRLLREKP